jgi:predicted transcriptional regulator
MGSRKKKPVGQVISVRVSDDEMATIREIMRISRKNTSAVMREAIRLFITPAHRI